MPKLSNCPLVPGWALYFRVSTDELQHPDVSIPAQRREVMERLVNPSGLPVIREYIDKASAKRIAGRDAFQEMWEDAQACGFSHVGVQEWARFGRNLLEALIREKSFADLGIRVCAASMAGVDIATPGGWLTKSIRQVVAQWDNMQRAELTTDRMQECFRQGRWVWKAPDGYKNARIQVSPKKSSCKIEVDPDRAPLIRSIFHRYQTGDYTLAGLAEELNGEGYRQPLGGLWTKQGVLRVLVKEFYAGWCVSEKWGMRVRGEHEALVSQDTFDICQAILRRERSRPKPRRHVYPLGRVLWNAELDCRMYSITCTGERCGPIPYHYTWRHKDKRGHAIYVQARAIEQQIPGLLRYVYVTPEECSRLRREYADHLSKAMETEWRDEKRRLRRQEATLQREHQNLVRLATKGLMNDEEFARARAEIVGELATVRAKLQEFTRGKREQVDRLDRALLLLSKAPTLWAGLTAKDQKALAELIFRRIVVNRQGQILEAELWPPLDWLAAQTAGVGSETVRLGTPERTPFEPLNWPTPAMLPALERLLI